LTFLVTLAQVQHVFVRLGKPEELVDCKALVINSGKGAIMKIIIRSIVASLNRDPQPPDHLIGGGMEQKPTVSHASCERMRRFPAWVTPSSAG
jgi:hypothetical protein